MTAPKRRADMTPDELAKARENGRRYARERKERYNAMKAERRAADAAAQQPLIESTPAPESAATPEPAPTPSPAPADLRDDTAPDKQTAPTKPPKSQALETGYTCGSCGAPVHPGQLYCTCGDEIDWRGTPLEESPQWVICDNCGAAHSVSYWRGKCQRCGTEYGE